MRKRPAIEDIEDKEVIVKKSSIEQEKENKPYEYQKNYGIRHKVMFVFPNKRKIKTMVEIAIFTFAIMFYFSISNITISDIRNPLNLEHKIISSFQKIQNEYKKKKGTEEMYQFTEDRKKGIPYGSTYINRILKDCTKYNEYKIEINKKNTLAINFIVKADKKYGREFEIPSGKINVSLYGYILIFKCSNKNEMKIVKNSTDKIKSITEKMVLEKTTSPFNNPVEFHKSIVKQINKEMHIKSKITIFACASMI